MVKKKTGWQFNVYFYEDYVIKEKRSYQEIRERISGYLKRKGKSESDIEQATIEAIENIDTSYAILKRSNCPPELIGNPVFFDETPRFKQDRAVDLEIRIRNLLTEDRMDLCEQVLDEFTELILELWKFGIHEKTYKLDNYGYIEKKMVLLDPFELTEDPVFIREQLRTNDWRRVCQRYRFPAKLQDYIEVISKDRLTVENFDNLWKIQYRETGYPAILIIGEGVIPRR